MFNNNGDSPGQAMGAPDPQQSVGHPPIWSADEPPEAGHAHSTADSPPSAEPAQSQATGKRESQAVRLVQLANQAGIELFQFEDEAFATFPVDDHREVSPIRATSFKRWLRQLFYCAEGGSVPGSQALQDALSTLEGTAIFDGPRIPLYVRVGEHEGCIYIDLANDKWEVIRIDENGWQIVSNPPVKFRRPNGMLPLPHPVAGGNVDELRPFLNLGGEDDWRLVVGWLLAAFRPRGPYPVLVLNGEQGSAKSTTTRVLREVVDPNRAPLRSPPEGTRDLMIAAKCNWTITMENVSHIRWSQSDTLCAVSTGAAFATRALYTDDEETLFSASRPIVINGIGEIVTRSDLLDRALLICLPSIGEKRRPEDEFWAEFRDAQPRVFGAILDTVAGALKNLPTVQLDHLPRMADFAKWGTAAENSLGWPTGSFINSYRRNQDEANSTALISSPIGQAVLLFMKDQNGWSGTASELLHRLAPVAGTEVTRRRDWPQTAQGLSTALRRIAPNLRQEGISVDFDRQAHTGIRLIHLTKGVGPFSDHAQFSL
jgi:hypothetical protein